jgi:cellulose synthase/poly-beta-1,6-N-acetylglucosamine synthase-like glycosyltransferase
MEVQILNNMLHFLHIQSFLMGGNLFVGSSASPSKTSLPIFAQIIFLIFFPTLAITSRINFKMRAKILLFGLLCFLGIILAQFLTILTTLAVGIIASHTSSAASRYAMYTQTPIAFTQTSILLTTVCGGLIVELTLFSTMTIPVRTKIKPIIKRSYRKEYMYLVIVLLSSASILYFFVKFLLVETDSPVVTYVIVNLNLTNALTLSYFVANLIYEIKWANWLNWTNSPKRQENISTISFLISAYNEEKIIRRCIESIDKAASKYRGKTEIILINDGSTDQTKQIASEALRKLKYSSGTLYNIPNSGKGFALAYGLQRTSGDVIFRTDADSVIDENAIGPMMNHFRDPQVGSVSGFVFPLNGETFWQKVQNVMFVLYIFIKRGQDLVDSILAQPGPSTAFRRDALIKIGGWVDNIFGEDGEITNRIARYGYRGEFEQRSIVYSDEPKSLIGFMQQRARWSVAFFHSRGRNLELVKEFRSPRSLVFLYNLLSHGIGFGHGLIWVYIIGATIAGSLNFSLSHVPTFLIWRLVAVQLAIYGIEIMFCAYYLNKLNKFSDLKYFPVLRLISLILTLLVKPQVMEVLLSWSSRWKKYNTKSFKALRKEVNTSVDPMYPKGEEPTSDDEKMKIGPLKEL